MTKKSLHAGISAQTASSGSVTGQVTDPQGAVVAGADVALLDATTNTTRAAVTNDGGRYSFPVVQPGVYDITITKSGFKTARFAQQKISLGLLLTVNAVLEVGSVAETVVITATATGAEREMRTGGFSHQRRVYTRVAVSSSAWLGLFRASLSCFQECRAGNDERR